MAESATETTAPAAPPASESRAPAIEVRHLTKRYGSLYAIDDVSFTVSQGEIVGFLGPNGAGKSTTMRVLSGLSPATSGEAYIRGLSVARQPAETKRRIGYMPEHNPLPDDMRVVEFLKLRARLKEIPLRKIRSRVDEVMEICDLRRKARRRIIGNLSKGYRQRVGIADAILANPEVIIMDEPTIGLDPHQVLSIRHLIDNLRGRMTVILSSHILPEIEMACDRVIIINQGHIVASGTSEALRKEFIQHTTWRATVRTPMLSRLETILREEAPGSRIDGRQPSRDGADTVLFIRAALGLDLGNRLINRLHAEDPEALREIAHMEPNLEDIFMAATRKSWKDTSVPFKRQTPVKSRKGANKEEGV